MESLPAAHWGKEFAGLKGPEVASSLLALFLCKYLLQTRFTHSLTAFGPSALLRLSELLWGLWQSFWNPVSYVAVPQGTWAGLSTMEAFTGLVNACSPGLAWVLKHFLGLCTWGVSSTCIFCCQFMQFLVHFPTPSVPLHLQLCIKSAQKTSLAEEYRNYLDASFDEHLNWSFCVEVL